MMRPPASESRDGVLAMEPPRWSRQGTPSQTARAWCVPTENARRVQAESRGQLGIARGRMRGGASAMGTNELTGMEPHHPWLPQLRPALKHDGAAKERPRPVRYESEPATWNPDTVARGC